MEQARLLIAIGLSFLVLFVWSMFFTDQTPVNNPDLEKNQTKIAEQPTGTPSNDLSETNAIQSTIQDIKPADKKAIQQADAREITVDTPFYRTRLSAKGAAFTSFILKAYRESVDADSANKELIPPEFKDGIIRTSLLNQSVDGLGNAVFSIDNENDQISLKGEKKDVIFKWIGADGTILYKTYTFDPSSYLIGLKVTLKNPSQRIIKDQLVLSLRKPIEKESGYGFVGPSALIDDSLEQVKTKKIKDKDTYPGKIKWIGIEDRYFISSIIPGSEIEGSINLEVNETDNVVTNRLINPVFELSPGNQIESQFFVFMGPKSMEVLNSLGHELGKALNFGFFDIIAKPCLWFMNKIHSIIPNYGIAIILLTIFTKILLWPLGNKSYKSMSEMKKLQPLMAELREKYKDDKQKMNQELMALYRTYKVNPVGGCLPMVLQIPVFFALYRMLYQAIELRHAPFFLWINDLSAPDRLFDFGFKIPFMEPPYGIPVLTIIMGATMLLQQKMSPPPGDPTQAKMMMLMPVVFTFIFINFSSGLVLYWLVNNLISISQQYYVQKKTI